MNIWIMLQGFGLGASMLLPIGAQNAYVLNQGIKKNHHLTTATLCSFLDALLIAVGVFGGGAILSQNEVLLSTVTVAGILFLTVYGSLSLKDALNEKAGTSTSTATVKSRKAVIFGVLAVSLLNPHVYLDTIVVLGSMGGQFEGNDRLSFALGTMLASFVWFYTLSIGASMLSVSLAKPRVKAVIDITVAMIMFFIAISLAKGLWLQYF